MKGSTPQRRAAAACGTSHISSSKTTCLVFPQGTASAPRAPHCGTGLCRGAHAPCAAYSLSPAEAAHACAAASSTSSGLPAVVVVRHLCLKHVHLRLHVEDASFECSKGLEQIHGGVAEHFDPDRRVLTLPELAQRVDPRPEAVGLAGDRVDPLPCAPESDFELVQRIPQRGQQSPGRVGLRHTLSPLSSAGIPACSAGRF